MNKCPECGKPTDNELRACKGHCSYLRMTGHDEIIIGDIKTTMSCNCCDDCRELCHQDMMEEYKDIKIMKAKDLITQLQKLDPEGELELVANTNDGYAYTVWSADKGICNEGILSDEGEVNCIVLDATT